MGEDEGLALVVGEVVEEEFEFDVVGVVVGGASGEFGSSGALVVVDGIGARSSGNGEEPPECVGVGAVGVEAAESSEVGVLNDVVKVVAIAEVKELTIHEKKHPGEVREQARTGGEIH